MIGFDVRSIDTLAATILSVPMHLAYVKPGFEDRDSVRI